MDTSGDEMAADPAPARVGTAGPARQARLGETVLLLRALFEVFGSEVGTGRPDLTLRQLTILLAVYLTAPPRTVRSLSASLGLGKPVITRALDSLSKQDLVIRRRDPADRRSVVILRTEAGRKFLADLGARLAGSGEMRLLLDVDDPLPAPHQDNSASREGETKAARHGSA